MDETRVEGVYYCGSVKMIHKGFFLATLEKLTKEWPGESHIVMKSNPIVTGDKQLMAIVNK